MTKSWVAAGAIVALQLASPAAADPAAEKYVDDAVPYMQSSCESVVEEAAGNDAYIATAIRSLVAVSLYNRDVDVAWFSVDDADKAEMHDKFVDALKIGCKADKNALLAGVIDQAVAKALEGHRPQ